jgi:hypothetical protein
MNRLPTSLLITRGLEIAERHLGLEGLVAELGAPAELIRAWRLGHATMPERKFLKLVDILTDLDPNWTDRSQP